MRTRTHSEPGSRRLIALAIALGSIVSIPIFAQTPPEKPKPTYTRPADEEALQKAALIKEPAEQVEALVKVVNDHPKAVYIRNVSFYLMRGLKPVINDLEKLRPLLNRFVEGTATATPYARSEFYNSISKELINNGVLLDMAERLAKETIPLLNEQEYVDKERRALEQKEAYYNSKDPNRKQEQFSVAEATEKYRAFRAQSYATLGRAYLKVDKKTEAEEAFKKAYEIKPTMDAAVGLADLAEKRGDDKEAFEHLADAILTGRLAADGIQRLHALYQKLHGGKLDGLEANLDAKYLSRPRTKLEVERYVPAKGTENARTVLAEFVTGAGCEPCTAVDISFDAELERYSRRELVLLVYPMHAPVSDPMSNHSAEARHKYYDTHGAPTIYLDGKNLNAGEGLATESSRVYKDLDAAVLERVKSKADARIKLNARLEGSTVKVEATIDQISGSSADLRLHVALVEDRISYSGENGLRFHPMVVRNLARPTEDYGFAVKTDQPAAFQYTFDLEKVTAENLKYYDDYIADMKKRLGDRFQVSFKEKRYIINPDLLSVVAFVQNDKTKEVLQAVYFKVAANQTSSR
jgi:hypothetical protein